jgi:hypothetical protein
MEQTIESKEIIDSDGNVIIEVVTNNAINYYNKKNDVHRIGGPAIIYRDYKAGQRWIKNGQYHREDGPAVTTEGQKYLYFLHGEEVSKEEFYRRMLKRRSEKLKSS